MNKVGSPGRVSFSYSRALQAAHQRGLVGDGLEDVPWRRRLFRSPGAHEWAQLRSAVKPERASRRLIRCRLFEDGAPKTDCAPRR